MHCTNCGDEIGDAKFCASCGTAQDATSQPAPPPPGAVPAPAGGEVSGKRVTAGVLGIVLGGLGVHKFYLGYTTAGILTILITIVTCGIAGPIIGLIEGILYLTKSDQEFDATYVHGEKAWF